MIAIWLGRLLLIAGMGISTFMIFACCAPPIERWFNRRAEKAAKLSDRISKL